MGTSCTFDIPAKKTVPGTIFQKLYLVQFSLLFFFLALGFAHGAKRAIPVRGIRAEEKPSGRDLVDISVGWVDAFPPGCDSSSLEKCRLTDHNLPNLSGEPVAEDVTWNSNDALKLIGMTVSANGADTPADMFAKVVRGFQYKPGVFLPGLTRVQFQISSARYSGYVVEARKPNIDGSHEALFISEAVDRRTGKRVRVKPLFLVADARDAENRLALYQGTFEETVRYTRADDTFMEQLGRKANGSSSQPNFDLNALNAISQLSQLTLRHEWEHCDRNAQAKEPVAALLLSPPIDLRKPFAVPEGKSVNQVLSQFLEKSVFQALHHFTQDPDGALQMAHKAIDGGYGLDELSSMNSDVVVWKWFDTDPDPNVGGWTVSVPIGRNGYKYHYSTNVDAPSVQSLQPPMFTEQWYLDHGFTRER